MSQQSQFSEGGLSDIIPDVEKFIEEHGMIEDIKNLMGAVPNGNDASASMDTTDDYKNVPLLLQFPPEEPQDLCTDEYPGPLNFEVLIIPTEQKKAWQYSIKLNKIFIGINVKFPVAFSVDERPPNMNLFIRATPIYSESQFYEELVHRCVGHQHPTDPSNKGLSPHIHQHIIRCSNEKAQYFGNKNRKMRLSVVVPLGHPQTGSDVVKEFYHFVCQNSCPLGMNRRPIDVVFSLEDGNGRVLGRKLVSVRVCSCAKRDREKEENDVESSDPPKGKKRKRTAGNSGRRENGDRRQENGEAVDTTVYPLTINVIGKNNYLHILAAGRDRMAAEILRNDRGASCNLFRTSYNEWSNLIEKTASEEFLT